jgi:hypothetical protein
MAFVKLDCGMLDSTLWVDRAARELFITALLMAEPRELLEPLPQIALQSLEPTGFIVPPGWYGFIPAAGSGIIRRAGMEAEVGMQALERLGAPENESRTPAFDGRRLVRIDGGFIALNFEKYRQKDHTTAERSRRYRERKFSMGTSAPLATGKFTKPTIGEVKLHFPKIGLPLDEADRFWNYYESNGWRVGNNPMKSWTAAASNWKKRVEQKKSEPPTANVAAIQNQTALTRVEERLKYLRGQTPLTDEKLKTEWSMLKGEREKLLAALNFKA